MQTFAGQFLKCGWHRTIYLRSGIGMCGVIQDIDDVFVQSTKLRPGSSDRASPPTCSTSSFDLRSRKYRRHCIHLAIRRATASIFLNNVFVNLFAMVSLAVVKILIGLISIKKNPSQSPPSSICSEEIAKPLSPSIIRRRIRKSSAERKHFWTPIRLRRIESITLMVIAVFTLVIAVGECDLAPRQQRRQTTPINVQSVRRLDFYDANGYQRGAATMGGRINMTLAISPPCSGVFSLLDAVGLVLGEGTCGTADDSFVEFNVIDQLTLGQFKIKIEETESEPFEPYIYYILVNRPIGTSCMDGHVYAKMLHAGRRGVGCFTLTSELCSDHYERSSKTGCPPLADEGGQNSYCYGVVTKHQDKKPYSETEKDKGCKGDGKEYNPYTENIPNDDLIIMHKDYRTIGVYSTPGTSGNIKHTIDFMNGSIPFEGNDISFTTPAGNVFFSVFDLPPEFFNEPFKAVLEVQTIFDDGQVFYTRHDLIYLETEKNVSLTTKYNKNGDISMEYKVIGDLVELCNRNKNMVCGLNIAGQNNQGTIVTKPTFYYGFYTGSGQDLFFNEITPELEPDVTLATEKLPTGDGKGNTDDTQRCPTTTPCASCTSCTVCPTPNSTHGACGGNNAYNGRGPGQWIAMLGGLVAVMVQSF